MGQDDIVRAAELLLDFASLSKKQAREFTAGMNLYLFSSPLARRQMIRHWEEQVHSSSIKKTDKTNMER